METSLTIPPGVPGIDRARKRIIDLQRTARDEYTLANRIITLANADPRVEEPAKLVRLARILERSAGQHARMAAYLTDQLAEVCAAHAADP